MRISDIKTTADLKQVEEWNKRYDAREFRGSEATPVNMEAAKEIVDLRQNKGYTWAGQAEAEDPDTKWRRLDLCPGHHRKYGTNYAYIDDEHKYIRTYETAGEFYSH